MEDDDDFEEESRLVERFTPENFREFLNSFAEPDFIHQCEYADEAGESIYAIIEERGQHPSEDDISIARYYIVFIKLGDYLEFRHFRCYTQMELTPNIILGLRKMSFNI